MNSIDNIINILGYNNSEFLYYWNDQKTKDSIPSTLSFQIFRTLKELNPYAFYCIDNKPFVLFFQTPVTSDAMLSKALDNMAYTKLSVMQSWTLKSV